MASKDAEAVVPHKEWLADVTSEELYVNVGDPQTTGMFKKTTTYAVTSGSTSACSDNSERRRYSDFEWLYNILCARYPGLVVPAIPPKSMNVMAAGEAFIAQRCAGLDRFLKRLLLSPFLKSDPSVRHFLSSGSKNWDSLKKSTTTDASGNFLTRPGIGQYRSFCLDLVSGDGAGDDDNDKAVLESYKRLATVGSKAASASSAGIKKANTAGSATDKAYDDLTSKLAALSTISSSSESGPDSVKEALSSFADIMNQANNAIENYATHMYGAKEMASTHLSPALVEVQKSLDEVNSCLIRVDKLGAVLKKAESRKKSAETSLANLEASGKPDKNNKAHDLVESTTSQVDSLTKELAVTVRAVCAFEMKRALLFIGRTVAKAVLAYAEGMEQKERDLQQSWAAAAMKLDPDVPGTWKSSLVRLKLHGAAVDGSWLSTFSENGLDSLCDGASGDGI